MTRNRYIVTPGRVHIAVGDQELSLETACGRSLVDGLTIDSTGQRIQTLDDFPHVAGCRACWQVTGDDPPPAGFAPRSRWAKRRRPR